MVLRSIDKVKEMKKIICLFLCALSIIFCSACSLSGNAKRISVEETEEHFNKYVADIDECIRLNEIEDYDTYDHSFSNTVGNIYLHFKNDALINIYLANSGNSDTKGYETYSVLYVNDFSNEDNILNLDNSPISIFSVFLSNILNENITQNEVNLFLQEFKNSIGTPSFDENEIIEKFEKDTHFRKIPVKYRLNHQILDGGIEHYIEEIYFGEIGDNYTNTD